MTTPRRRLGLVHRTPSIYTYEETKLIFGNPKLFGGLTYFLTVGNKHVFPKSSVYEVVMVTGFFKSLRH